MSSVRVGVSCIREGHLTTGEIPIQEGVVSSWVDQGIMSKVQANKLVFIETQDFVETSLALQNYHKVIVAITVADTGGLQWFQLEPPLKERAPLIRDDWYREEQKSP